jgi:hypothetical protein
VPKLRTLRCLWEVRQFVTTPNNRSHTVLSQTAHYSHHRPSQNMILHTCSQAILIATVRSALVPAQEASSSHNQHYHTHSASTFSLPSSLLTSATHSTSTAHSAHMSTARPISMLYSSALYLCMNPKRWAAGICHIIYTADKTGQPPVWSFLTLLTVSNNRCEYPLRNLHTHSSALRYHTD